jgi:Mrp family chromosome partitioning ATPase
MKTTIEKRAVPGSLDATPQHLARRSVVVVASPGAEPTRADVAFNLATVCAEVGQRVAIVSTSVEDSPEAAPVRPRSDAGTPLSGSSKQVDLRDLLGDTSIPRVSLLDLKDLVDDPTHLVTRFPEILETLRRHVDVVIFDVPSFLTVHHGQALAPLADVVLVVAERRFTTFDQLRRTNAMLKRLGAPVVGMALTNEFDYWQAEDEPTQRSAARRPAFELRQEDAVRPEDVDGVGATVEEDAAAPPETHRRRRTVVDHASVGARSDQTDANAPNPEA